MDSDPGGVEQKIQELIDKAHRLSNLDVAPLEYDSLYCDGCFASEILGGHVNSTSYAIAQTFNLKV